MASHNTITNAQLAAVVANLLTNPFSDHIDSQESFEGFITDIANVICDYCGGVVLHPARYAPAKDSDKWGDHYQVVIGSSESSSEDDVFQAPPVVVAPADVFSILLDMSSLHVDAIKKGIEKGTYKAIDEVDLSTKELALEKTKPIVQNHPHTSFTLSTSNLVDIVPVKCWNDYNDDKGAMTHQIDVDDRRATAGQIFVDVGALEGPVDDFFGVTLEVNANPLNSAEYIPCMHIHFDSDNCALSLFKIGDRILMRPGTDRPHEQFIHQVHGVAEALYWIDSVQ